jgi:DinB superfamily
MMKTIFDKATREALISRINTLNEQSIPQWGKMNIYEMLKHCITYEEMMLGKQRFKRAFVGLLFGKMALKDFVGDEREFKRNVPTLPQLKVKAAGGNVAAEKSKWITLLEEYTADDDRKIVHAFFGPLTWEQVGQLVYKHTDHHLRQFNS